MYDTKGTQVLKRFGELDTPGRYDIIAAHHQTDWDSFQVYRHKLLSEANYPINDPLLVVDTVRPLHEIIDEVIVWLDRHSGQLT